jgi:Tfp pilus assembly protein PilV
MLRIACNKRGLSIIEVLITLFLTTVGIMALLSMQPQSWKAASRSDFMGRAAGILHSELERNEIWIMNPGNSSFAAQCDPNRVNLALGSCTWTINASSQSTQQAGDVPFTVNTTIAPFGASTNAWTVAVKVTWPGNTRGVWETAVVSRQETFRQ